MITNFTQLLEHVRTGRPMRLIGVAAEDDATILAMYEAEKEGLITPVLVGNQEKIQAVLQKHQLQFANAEFIQADTFEQSAAVSVELIRQKRGDVLMKGLLDTSIFLKAIVNKQTGLPIHGLLSHVMVFSVPAHYPKLILTSDGGMVLYPDLEQKKHILHNSLLVAKALEISHPMVAVLCAKEKVNPKMPATVDAAALKELALAGEFGPDVTVEGPISMDLAFSKEHAQVKGYTSAVCGETDIVILPNIEAGNIMGKTISTLYGDSCAGVIAGCRTPIVMPSRGDTDQSKLYAIALGCAMARVSGQTDAQ